MLKDLKVRKSKVKKILSRMTESEIEELVGFRSKIRLRLKSNNAPKKAVRKQEQLISEAETALVRCREKGIKKD
jgi:hypothetical protein